MTLHDDGPVTDRATTATATTQVDNPQPTVANTSRQVSWALVHEFVTPILARMQLWPMVGTLAWWTLDDTDPRKWASLLDAAQHWALRVENCQESIEQAGQAISAAIDWRSVAQERLALAQFYAARPWMKPVP